MPNNDGECLKGKKGRDENISSVYRSTPFFKSLKKNAQEKNDIKCFDKIVPYLRSLFVSGAVKYKTNHITSLHVT